MSYFGIFAEQDASGLDKDGVAKPGRHTRMSRKGNDLVRKYLWNAARTGITFNPAIRALFQRLRARGTRGDVALGHCMRKLLHLVFAVWKTGRPFDPQHYPWQQAAVTMATTLANEKTAGHNQDDSPDPTVVTAAASNLPSPPTQNQATVGPLPPRTPPVATGSIDFAALRRQVSMEQVLAHLGWLSKLKGSGPQRRAPCPVHARQEPGNRSFSVHLTKQVFQCFHPPCGAHGNVLDLWSAAHRLPLHEAARHLAETFHVDLSPTNATEKRNP